MPAEIVHTDYTRDRDGYFLAGSNGLASGNHLVEATIAAICELIERDALALWQAGGIRLQAASGIDLASVDDPACRRLLDKYAAPASMSAFGTQRPISASRSFSAKFGTVRRGDPGRLRRFPGSGCHPDRAIALVRALTEAAQTRLTYIAGIRDDLLPTKYQEPPMPTSPTRCSTRWRGRASRRLSASPASPGTIWRAICTGLLARLAAAGIVRAVAVDLTRADFAIPVVRDGHPGAGGRSETSELSRGIAGAAGGRKV